MPSNASRFPTHIAEIKARTGRKRPFLVGAPALSYGELFDAIGKTSHLFKDMGLAVGDRVVIACGDERDVAALYLACLATGVTAVMIDPASSAAEANLLITLAEPGIAFLDESLFAEASSIATEEGARVIAVKRAEPSRTTFGLLRRRKAAEPGADDSYPGVLEPLPGELATLGDVAADTTAVILFTSGTTSRPKGVELTHGNLFAQFATFERHYGFDGQSRILNHLPLHHTDGLHQGPALALFCGGAWLRPPPVTLNTLPDLLYMAYRDQATHLVTVPTVFALMLRLPDEFDDSFRGPEFRFALSTAGYLEENLWRAIEDRFGVMVVNSYGLTETVSEALYCGPSPETRVLGTIGRPIDCEARIVDSAGADVPAETEGELLLRGGNIMKGYFRNPEATAEVLRDGWLFTGDLATVDGDGIYRIVGRKKNVIIRGGLNVYPEDVTNGILEVAGVLDAVTFGLDDAMLGEKVVSCVTLDGTREHTATSLVAQCRDSMTPERIPNDIFIVDDLPRGPAGKVELQKVKTLAQQLGAAALGDVDGSTRDKVFTIASSVFKVPVDTLSGRSDDQSTEGWDSLSHLELIMSLERSFGVRLGPREVMNIRYLDDAVDVVETMVGAG